MRKARMGLAYACVCLLLLLRRRNIGTHPKLPIALLKIALYRRDQMLPELLEVSTRLLFTRRLPPQPRCMHPKPKVGVHLRDGMRRVLRQRALRRDVRHR